MCNIYSSLINSLEQQNILFGDHMLRRGFHTKLIVSFVSSFSVKYRPCKMYLMLPVIEPIAICNTMIENGQDVSTYTGPIEPVIR